MSAKVTKAMFVAFLDAQDENPFFCRLAIDKSCYEVGKALNKDWRTTVSDEQKILSKYDNYIDAEYEYKWQVFRFAMKAMEKAK